MGIAADSLFNVLMSWVRALVNALWALFSADRTTALEFLGKNWMAIAVVIIVCGLVIDWIVWLIRWQPYHLWARRIRRLLRLDELEEEPKKEKGKAHAAMLPEKRYAGSEAEEVYEAYEDGQDDETEEMDYGFDEEQAWAARPDDMPDVTLDESPDEHEAWRRMQEEARMRAEAERAERERIEREAREAERARREREAYEAEQARRAREAYEAEQARLAQEEYARQMAEYERQRAQYERDLAEYERQKAEYEAQLAAQQAYEAEQQAVQPHDGAARRRRAAASTAEMQHTQVMERSARPKAKQTAPKTAAPSAAKTKKPEGKREKPAAKTHEEKAGKAAKNHALLNRVAKLIEPEEEELITRTTLPPRVDMNDAFRTAKLPVVTPPRSGRRKK